MGDVSLKTLAVVAAAALCGVGPASSAAPVDAGTRLPREALVARYGRPGDKTIDLGGVLVAYRDEGHGPAILMVHGSVSTLRTFDRIVPLLKDRYRIIRYDIPPAGLSGSVSDAAAAMMKPADIAELLLERLNIHKATVVGVSSGGSLGVYLAAKRPDMVERLVLSNTPSDPVETKNMRQPEAFLAAQKEAARTGFQSQRFWDEFLDFFSGDPARINRETRTQYYDFNRRVPEQHPLAFVAQVADHKAAVAAMSRVTAPTLLIWGARDPLLTPPTAATLAKYLDHAQVSVVFMPDVGHYPPLEAPERFARIVASYLEDVQPPARR
jgi:pimeloyl-ACP methyl ester carboxylesterase